MGVEQAAPGTFRRVLGLLALNESRIPERHDETNITCGSSRDPPVLGRFGGISVETKFARAAGYDPKRLPSRRWA